MNQHATILELQRMSTEDGPGLRTTVFFKGCSLRCSWCHNPESIDPNPELVWHDWRCIGCKTCVEVCPHRARAFTAGGAVRDRSLCQECDTCQNECPAAAIERLGRIMTVDELMGEILRDRAFFDASKGGVTLSGGEPTLEADFAGALLDACRAKGIHTALDTCGQVAPSALLGLAKKADLILYDVKVLDDALHRRVTGQGSTRVLENLKLIVEAIRRGASAELWVRTPLVPGATATEENILAIGRHLADQAKDVLARWDLCAFNNLCRDKYKRLGRAWAFDEEPLLPQERIEALANVARSCGFDAEVVKTSGPVRAHVDTAAVTLPLNSKSQREMSC